MEVKPFKDRKDSRKDQVRDMFNQIAGQYDFLNHFLSFNTDKRWRRVLVKMLSRENRKNNPASEKIFILDVATGTGDLAFALSKIPDSQITGLDLAPEMLQIAIQKSKKRKSDIDWLVGDSENLPFPDSEFHFVTVAFGVRNYEDLSLGLKEMTRVLKPGGQLFILEFSKPGKGFFSWSYSLYSKKILPFLASLFTSEPRAYIYLPDSIAAFPSGEGMLHELKKAGLENAYFRKLTGGIASIYVGRKGSLQ